MERQHLASSNIPLGFLRCFRWMQTMAMMTMTSTTAPMMRPATIPATWLPSANIQEEDDSATFKIFPIHYTNTICRTGFP